MVLPLVPLQVATLLLELVKTTSKPEFATAET